MSTFFLFSASFFFLSFLSFSSFFPNRGSLIVSGWGGWGWVGEGVCVCVCVCVWEGGGGLVSGAMSATDRRTIQHTRSCTFTFFVF